MAPLKSLYLLSNGPGELLTWVKPLIPVLCKWFDVYLFLLPCQFASGREYEVASSWAGLKGVYSPLETWKFLLFGKSEGVAGVLQFGGDTFYGRWFKRKLGAVYIVYTMSVKVQEGVDYLITPYEVLKDALVSNGVSEDRVVVLGNPALLGLNRIDKVRARNRVGVKGDTVVGFLPGSRVEMFPESFDFMLEVAVALRKELPVDVLFLASRFIRDGEIEAWLRDHSYEWIHLVREEEKEVFFGACDVVVAPPGSNNLEAAYLTGRGIVVLPFEFLKYLPAPGIMHLFLKLPFVGERVKRKAVERYIERNRYLSWVNRLNNDCVFEEIVGYNIKGRVKESLKGLLSDGRNRQVRGELFSPFKVELFKEFLERVLA